jgi:hypothetical protein
LGFLQNGKTFFTVDLLQGWITSCGTGRLKQMNLSFSFFLRNNKLKALIQTVLYVALLLFRL